MTRSIFHQGSAKVPACQAPCAAQVENAVVDVDVGLCELCVISPKSERRCRFGPNLHEADLSDRADGARIVSAFNEDDGLGYVGGQIGLGRFSFDDFSNRRPRGRRLSSAEICIVTASRQRRFRGVQSAALSVYGVGCQPKHGNRNVCPRRAGIDVCSIPQHGHVLYLSS